MMFTTRIFTNIIVFISHFLLVFLWPKFCLQLVLWENGLRTIHRYNWVLNYNYIWFNNRQRKMIILFIFQAFHNEKKIGIFIIDCKLSGDSYLAY